MLTDAVMELLAERGEEPGALTPETSVGSDLGVASVEAIHLMIMLEDKLGVPLSFQDLAVRDGEYVDDLSLGEIAAFVCRSVGIAQGSSPASA
jgi:acyl carrier protein